MKNILVPTDFSENSWNALAYALALFKDSRCNFYLLHVNKEDKDDTYHPESDIPGITENFSTKVARRKLSDLILKIEKSPLKSNHRFFIFIDQGNFVDTIRNQVLKKNIDLIVMGTRGASGTKNIGVGRNTSDVITRVKCSALVIPDRARYDTIKEVIFPTDYTIFYPPSVLEPLSYISDMCRALVKVAYLSKTDDRLTSEQGHNKELLQEYFRGEPHSFHTLTNRNMEDAVQGFIENKERCLIAMPAKNIHFFQQLFFNFSTEKCDYHTRIPILVLHE